MDKIDFRMKQCVKCKKSKPIKDFRKPGKITGQVPARCLECVAAEPIQPAKTRICSFCGLEKPKADFKPKGAKRGAAFKACNKCRETDDYEKTIVEAKRIREANYRKKNRERINATARRSIRKKRQEKASN